MSTSDQGVGSFFLGVDGGGSKTAVCLITSTGRLVASMEAESCYYLGSEEGTSLVGRVLSAAFDTVCDLAGITVRDVTFAFVGLPAYGEVAADVPALDAAVDEALGHGRHRCANDMVCGWAGSLGARDGINVISGTGSMTYGERRGRSVRVGGWGELFGDEGSGHWIGQQALQAFSRMSDGRLPEGPLHPLLRAHLALRSDTDLIALTLTRWQRSRRHVAALSRPLAEAARRGDEVASSILSEAARELVLLVDTSRRRLDFSAGETVPVSYTGGVFTIDEVLTQFCDLLAGQDAPYDVRAPLWTPVVGAAIYAAGLCDMPLSAEALTRLADEV